MVKIGKELITLSEILELFVRERRTVLFEKLNFSINRVYPTLVVSTMSSGKSTLINAIVMILGDIAESELRTFETRQVSKGYTR